MILYHGSCVEIQSPDVIHSRKNIDFGVGFYTTPILSQAQKWSLKFKDKGEEAIISIYQLDEMAFEKYKVLRFDTYSDDWLDFVVSCRNGMDTSEYDIVMGGVANDKVFNTVELYLSGLINKHEAIGRLRYENPNYQIAFRNQIVIDEMLQFLRSEKYDG